MNHTLKAKMGIEEMLIMNPQITLEDEIETQAIVKAWAGRNQKNKASRQGARRWIRANGLAKGRVKYAL